MNEAEYQNTINAINALDNLLGTVVYESRDSEISILLKSQIVSKLQELIAKL